MGRTGTGRSTVASASPDAPCRSVGSNEDLHKRTTGSIFIDIPWDGWMDRWMDGWMDG